MPSDRYSDKGDSYFSNAREDILRIIPGGINRLLDVGCGNGETAARAKVLLDLVETVGIELHEPSGLVARDRLDSVLIGDIEELALEFPDGHFDCILCADVLEHTKDPSAVLRKLHRVLSDGGILIASIPNIRHIVPVLRIIFNRFEYEDSGILDRTHLRFFTMHTIRRMFQGTGFRIETVNSNRSVSWKFHLLNILSFGLLRPFSVYQYIVAVRKEPPDGGLA